MLLTWVLVINGVRVLADNQVFSICLLQHMSTVVGMLIAHLYRMLVMIRAEEKIIGLLNKMSSLNNIPFYKPYVPCVNGHGPDIQLWHRLSRIHLE